jgi:hypothetical protein
MAKGIEEQRRELARDILRNIQLAVAEVKAALERKQPDAWLKAQRLFDSLAAAGETYRRDD